MVEKKQRTIGYRRAEWLIDNPASISLSSCVKQAMTKLKSIEDRTISRGLQLLKPLSMSADLREDITFT